MRRSLKYLLFALFLVDIVGNLFAQSSIIGNWQEFLSYQKGRLVAVSPNQAFAANDNGVLVYHRSSGELERLSKVQGLSNLDITAMAYHHASDQLVIGYASGDVDFYSNGNLFNLPAIRLTSINSGKKINRIREIAGRLYLGCDFGLVELDPDKREVRNFYYPGVDEGFLQVLDFASDGNTMVLATPKGARFASLDNGTLPYPCFWSYLGSLPWGKRQLDAIACLEGTYYANHRNEAYRTDTVWTWKDSAWQVVDTLSNKSTYHLEVVENRMVITHSEWIQVVDANLETVSAVSNYQLDVPPRPGHALFYEGKFWIADLNKGLVFGANNQFQELRALGPPSSAITGMSARNGSLWVAPGGKNSGWRNRWLQGGIYGFSNGDWLSVDRWKDSRLDTVFDFIAIESDPQDQTHVYAGSLGDGIWEFQNGTLIGSYNHENSTLSRMPAADPAWNWIGITDLNHDRDGNLWVTNTAVNNPFSVKTPAGEWHTFDLSEWMEGHIVDQTLIASSGTKWAILPRGGGVLIFREEGTLEDVSDDRARILTENSGEGGFPSDQLHCIAEDLDTNVWIGTSSGLVQFVDPEQTIWENQVVDAARAIAIPEDAWVKSLAVDHQNRKWVGTENRGLYVLDEQGEQVLAQFTQSDSPLFSNSIIALEYDPSIQTMYIGTDLGLLAFSLTEVNSRIDCSEVYAYPNPVPPEHQFGITISGLQTDAVVRITDLAGNLVYEALSDGESLVWDQMRFDGEPVSSGIYLMFTQKPGGREACTTKLLLLNQ